MKPVGLKFGIPDLELGCASGTKINPSSFSGHDLIALFCPSDPTSASQEIAAYRKHCAEFVENDAWLLIFLDRRRGEVAVDGGGRVLTISDPDGHAWLAFRDLIEDPEELDRKRGATFLFTRGGGLHRCWQGSGHVDEVVAELGTPSSLHSHQMAS